MGDKVTFEIETVDSDGSKYVSHTFHGEKLRDEAVKTAHLFAFHNDVRTEVREVRVIASFDWPGSEEG